MTQTQQTYSLSQLFDLIAPIAITGGADCNFESKARKAWSKITRNPISEWSTYNCVNPHSDVFLNVPEEWDISDDDDFNDIYRNFAWPNYDALFDAIINEYGDGNWELIHDYWGAKGYMRPEDNSKSVSLVGDSGGQLPWYETAELLIERIKEIESGH